MKNILLLSDFSDTSINAIHYALHLLKKDTCDFFLMHVKQSHSYLSDDLVMSGNESIYNSLVKKSKSQLEELIAEIHLKFKNKSHKFHVVIDYDNITDAINQIRVSKHIDMIVMGSNGATSAKEVIFGSNTINVIRKVDCTTLVVPEGYHYQPPNEIMLPLDLEDSLSGNSIKMFNGFAEKYSKRVHVLRIKPNNEKSQEGHKDEEHADYFFKNLNYKYHIITDVPMHYSIDNYQQTHQVSLIALIVQPETLLERFFMGSATKKISDNLKVPLIVFHSK